MYEKAKTPLDFRDNLACSSSAIIDPSSSKEGVIFNIQKFSLHDGPGIRDLVFLKGCPLQCQWCSNPESQNMKPELLFNEQQCIGTDKCGLCLKTCPANALSSDDGATIKLDRSKCTRCCDCVAACPTRALEQAGKPMTITSILKEVEKDGGFHFRSGGGITISGGEPMLQSSFAAALLRECKNRFINTAVETTGYGAWEKLAETVEHADAVLYDIKSMDATKHRVYTGVPNDIILENLDRMLRFFPGKIIAVRTPVIPGFNDSEKDITEITSFLHSRDIHSYELLPFHRLGIPKYHYLGKTCSYADAGPIDTVTMDRLNSIAASLKHPCYNKS